MTNAPTPAGMAELLARTTVETPEVFRLTLCGSTKFRAEYELWNKRLTLAGFLVYSVSGFGHSGDSFTDEEKARLDQVHLAKIDASHAIVVLNVGGYIGDSTAREIAHAKTTGKPVYFLEGDNVVYRLRTGPDGHKSLRYRAFDYLAAQPSAGAEPVAYVDDSERGSIRWGRNSASIPNGTKLYTHPAPVLTAETLEGLQNLKHQFERIAVEAPEDQPRYRNGDRPFGTGDLRHFIQVLSDATATPAQPDSGGVERSDALTPRQMDALHDAFSRILAGEHDGDIPVEVYERAYDKICTMGRRIAALAPVAAEGGEKDKLREAVIVAKNMADNAVYNLNQAGLTSETATCERAFQDIYSTLNAALRTEPTGGGEGA